MYFNSWKLNSLCFHNAEKLASIAIKEYGKDVKKAAVQQMNIVIKKTSKQNNQLNNIRIGKLTNKLAQEANNYIGKGTGAIVKKFSEKAIGKGGKQQQKIGSVVQQAFNKGTKLANKAIIGIPVKAIQGY